MAESKFSRNDRIEQKARVFHILLHNAYGLV